MSIVSRRPSTHHSTTFPPPTYIFAISLPKIQFNNHVSRITIRFLQLLVHITLPLLHANQADLPVHPSRSPLPAIIPSLEPIYDTSCFSAYVNGIATGILNPVPKPPPLLKKPTKYFAFCTATSAVVGKLAPSISAASPNANTPSHTSLSFPPSDLNTFKLSSVKILTSPLSVLLTSRIPITSSVALFPVTHINIPYGTLPFPFTYIASLSTLSITLFVSTATCRLTNLSFAYSCNFLSYCPRM
ncbi:MAG: hypothetical protein Q9168_005488 [Polycauliona sp. 1 TL-2023]